MPRISEILPQQFEIIGRDIDGQSFAWLVIFYVKPEYLAGAYMLLPILMEDGFVGNYAHPAVRQETCLVGADSTDEYWWENPNAKLYQSYLGWKMDKIREITQRLELSYSDLIRPFPKRD